MEGDAAADREPRLRWDFEGPMYNDQQDLSTFDPSRGGLVVAGQQIEDLYPRSWKNFSPRLGMTYQPGRA